jgi:hypothetical protein
LQVCSEFTLHFGHIYLIPSVISLPTQLNLVHHPYLHLNLNPCIF